MRDLIQSAHNTRWVRFMIVGASGILVNLVVILVLHSLIGIGATATAMVAFLASASSSYALNYTWTFKDWKIRKAGGWVKYALMTWITMYAYIGAFIIFNEYLGMWYVPSIMLAVVLTYIGRYIIATDYIWKLDAIHKDSIKTA